jgi:hypothetical protein
MATLFVRQKQSVPFGRHVTNIMENDANINAKRTPEERQCSTSILVRLVVDAFRAMLNGKIYPWQVSLNFVKFI